MNTDNGSQSFSIRLTNDMLRRDAQASMKQFDRVNQHAVRTGTTIDKSFNTMSRNVSGAIRNMTGGIKASFADIAKSVTGFGALMASGSFISSLFAESKEFSKQMKIVSTISDDVANNLTVYKDWVKELCAQIAVAPATAAQALYQINSAGHLGADGMAVLEASAKSAVGGVTDVATAADAITTVLNAYSMESSQATAISDKLFTTVRLGKTTMDELSRSIAYVAPIAATYKISIDEILAAVAQLTKQGNSTQNAMTQISASIQAVASEMGDTAFEKGLMSALTEIEKRADGSNAALKAQLSNIRAVRGALGLTGQHAAETAQMIDEIRNSGGAAEKAFKTMNTTAGAELQKLRNNFFNEFAAMGDEANSILGKIAHGINEAFRTGEIKDVENELLILIGVYGLYKTAMAISVAVSNSANVAALIAERDALASLIPEKEANIGADVEAMVAKGKLTEAQGAEIIALRKELAQRVATAQAAKKLAADELASAKVAVTASNERVAALTREIETLTIVQGAAQQSGLAEAERSISVKLATALEAQHNVQLEAEAAAQRLVAAQTQYDTAATEANNLAKLQNNANIAKNTTQRGIWAAATRLNIALEEKLNAVISKNPWAVYAALLAVVAVGIYKVCTATTALSRQTKNANDVSKNATIEISKEISRLDILNERLKKAKKGSEQWSKAKQEAVNSYSQYLPQIDREISKVGDLTTSYQKLANAIRASLAAKAMEKYKESSTTDDDMDANLKRIMSYLDGSRIGAQVNYKGEKYNKVTDSFMEKIMKQITDYQSSGNESVFSADVLDILNNNSFNELHYGKLQRMGSLFHLAKRNRRLAESDERGIELVGRRYGFNKEDSHSLYNGTYQVVPESIVEPDGSENPAKKNKAFWEKQRDDALAALEAMDETERATAEGLNKKRELTEAYKELRKIGDELGDPTKGNGHDSGKTQAEKDAEAVQENRDRLDLEAQQARERARAAKDLEFQRREAQVAAMEEGGDKVLAAQQLQFEREQEELQREMEDAILAEIAYQKALFDAQEEQKAKQEAAKGNDHYAKRVFDPGTLGMTHDQSGKPLLQAGQEFAAQVGNINTTVINQVLKDYQELFQNTASAYRNTLNRANREAMNEYLRQWGDVMQQRNAIIAMANQKMNEATTQGERLGIAAQMRKELADFDFSLIEQRFAGYWQNAEKLSVKSIDAIIEEMERLRDNVEKIDDVEVHTFDNFSPQQIQQFADALGRLKAAKKAASKGFFSPIKYQFQNENAQERIQLQQQINELELVHNRLVDEKNAKEEQVNQKIAEILAKIRELKGNDFNVLPEDLSDPDKVAKIMEGLTPEQGEGLQTLLDGLGEAQSELLDIGTAADSTGNQLGVMQGMLQGLGSGFMQSMEKVAKIVHLVNQSVQDAAKLVHDLSDTAESFGADTSVGSGWDTATTLMDGFGEASEGATKAFDSLKSGNPIGFIQGVVQSFTGWIKAFNKIHDAKHEREIIRIQKQTEQLEEDYDRLGRSVDKAYSKDASRLIDQQNQMLKQQKAMIEMQIAEEKAKKNSDQDKIDEWEKTLRSINDTIEDNEAAMVDAIFGEDVKSAINNFADAYASMFDEGISKARASKNLVRDMIKKMIMEAMKSDLSAPMERVREMLNGYFADGVICDWEEKAVESYVENVMQEQAAKWGWADKYLKEANGQDGGTRGGFTAMSQDSADELNGRFTAIQMDSAHNRESLDTINEQLATASLTVAQVRENTAELRDLSLIAIDHLETISKNTHELFQMNERLGKIEKYTSRL